jgi:ubiquinone/menaquinone biosynthesis C-methylase UbiE
MPEENWDNQLDYLRNSRFLYHNDDYLEFLVGKVWHLNTPCSIVDFGCGLGYMGTKLLPLLPQGSSYTGIDKSVPLLDEARRIFTKLPYQSKFVQSEVYSVPLDKNSFDIAISHAVLMHLQRPVDALNEMIRVTRNGGMVITCNATRNAFNAMFYIDEVNTHEATSPVLSQQMHRHIRETEGIDYNIGIKTPVLMHKAGLKNIGCRISDCVICLFPTMELERRKYIHKALSDEGLGLPEDFEKVRPSIRDRLLGYGIDHGIVDAQLDFEAKMDFRHKGESYHTVFPGLMTWSFGTVEKETIK